MTMHLMRGITTTRTTKREVKLTKAQQAELERDWRDRNQRLKQMGLPKESYEQFLEWVYGKGKKENKASSKTQQHKKTDERNIKSPTRDQQDWANAKSIQTSMGACTKKPSPTYTGTEVVGIAVMHKSCLQPVFSQEEAEQSAHMRR